ncbi:hypothetical protein EVAR_10673_1 [Eumeta japonica]|uniref:BED-type domain-containing protein n=1 Tax=Eumeta variegata TaxID=151549 RepID=A0A4C1U6Y6_EUMVA|nr:hypothetical protein EVAR_10673_1 [Eumeta japonica]
MSTGRKKDPLWQYFSELPGESDKKTLRVKCKYCNKNMVGLIARMKAHLTKCSDYKSKKKNFGLGASSTTMRNDSDSSDDDDGVEVVDGEPIAKKTREDSSASTSSYSPPNRKNIGGTMLDEVNVTVKSDMEKYLRGKVVFMALDSWSNIRNEPIVCVSVTSTEDDGKVYLIDTIDTADKSHTSEYLLTLAVDNIKKCQSFGCQVRSFVTDNAADMAKMRIELMELEDDEIGDVITYGCSAHLLNLFAKDIQKLEINSKVKKIMKYFKYHHFPGATYKEAGGKALKLPQGVRWNTLADCLESYVKNCHCLAKVCSDHRALLDLEIVRHVQDIELKENIEEYLKKLKKVSMGLDTVQRETCILSDCTHTWKDLLSLD